MAANRVIGHEGNLPWHLPADLKFFKQLTTGGTVLMGRKTFQSIGRPLPRRRNVVLSRAGLSAPGIEVFPALEDFCRNIDAGERVYVIGGAEIYRLTRDLWTEVYLTRVCFEVEGDTFLPKFEDHFPKVRTIHEEPDFRIEHYRK